MRSSAVPCAYAGSAFVASFFKCIRSVREHALVAYPIEPRSSRLFGGLLEFVLELIHWVCVGLCVPLSHFLRLLTRLHVGATWAIAPAFKAEACSVAWNAKP